MADIAAVKERIAAEVGHLHRHRIAISRDPQRPPRPRRPGCVADDSAAGAVDARRGGVRIGLRRQIELVFEQWKGGGRIDESRSAGKRRTCPSTAGQLLALPPCCAEIDAYGARLDAPSPTPHRPQNG